jgi:hypothetical protein
MENSMRFKGKEMDTVGGRPAITSWATAEKHKSLGRAYGGWLSILSLGTSVFMSLSMLTLSTPSWAGSGETSEHFSKYLEFSLGDETIPQKLNFPLYEQNNIQYFSAGLGKEERSLSYPPYSLKLIFVKGQRAFLANVAISVLQPDGTTLISIPSEEVQGPWMFLNLPVGKYVVQATDSGGTTLEKSINLAGKKTTTVHFRWP